MAKSPRKPVWWYYRVCCGSSLQCSLVCAEDEIGVCLLIASCLLILEAGRVGRLVTPSEDDDQASMVLVRE